MTKAKSNVVSDFVLPIAVLVIICVVMSALLALTNKATAPIIAEAEQVEQAGLPDAVKEVYQAANGAGYTFSLTTTGYGGKNTLKMTIGIDGEGKLTGVKVLSHKETPGLGSKVTTEEGFYGQFPGLDAAGAAAADTISGATFSSNYYKAAIADAFAAFDMVKG